jgi:hypothetical protein
MILMIYSNNLYEVNPVVEYDLKLFGVFVFISI